MCLPSFVGSQSQGRILIGPTPNTPTPWTTKVAEEMAACDWPSLDHVLPLGELWLTVLSETHQCVPTGDTQ